LFRWYSVDYIVDPKVGEKEIQMETQKDTFTTIHCIYILSLPLVLSIHNKQLSLNPETILQRSVTGSVPLVLDLRITHDRFGSSSDPNLNGKIHDPNDIDRSLNETADDKIRKYRADYINNPPNAISFKPAIASTSGSLHSEFIRILFLQTHRETDRFFATSGVSST